MLYYTCDRCKRVLDPVEDLRYVVRLEVEAAMDPVDMDEVDDDRDHLLEVHEILERTEDLQGAMVGDDIYQRKRYDLCPECYQRFIRNPVGAEPAVHLTFSEN